jgi:hypothetical protein
MRISEVIKELLEIKNIHGDLEVKTEAFSDDCGDWTLDDIRLVEFDDIKYVKIS